MLKPLPKLDDAVAMAAWGRRSALMKARNEACEALRDAAVSAQSQDIGSAGEGLEVVPFAIERLKQIARLWNAV